MLRSTLDLASSLERARRRPHKRACHINAERLAARQVHAKSRLGCGTALDHFLPTGMGGVSIFWMVESRLTPRILSISGPPDNWCLTTSTVDAVSLARSCWNTPRGARAHLAVRADLSRRAFGGRPLVCGCDALISAVLIPRRPSTRPRSEAYVIRTNPRVR